MVKKNVLLTLVFLFTLMASYAVFGQNEAGEFLITAGIVDEEGRIREKESTFDEKRTIAGLAPKDTSVEIAVCRLVDGEKEVLDLYELTVGFSGMFSQTVNLYLEDNYIELTAVLNGETYEYSCVITRKPANIKTELQNSGTLPWQIVPGKK